MVKYLLGGIGNFIGGMAGEFIDWLAAVVAELGDRIGDIFGQVLHVFDFVPRTVSFAGRLLRGVFFMVPGIVFNILYAGISLVGIIVLFRLFIKFIKK